MKGVALLGYGTVGSGAYELLSGREDVAVKLVLARRRRAELCGEFTDDFSHILNDPEISIVAEAMGGDEPAFSYIMAALKAKKNVVSANKQVLCSHFKELHDAAAQNGVQLRYTAAAGGGVPWLFNILRQRRIDEILSFTAMINGTSNFILDAMAGGADFDAVLKEAQALGYAEADPAADIDGHDLLRKCVLSANLAFDGVLDENDLSCAGIRHICAEDVFRFRDMGYGVSLLASAGRANGGVYAYVEPTLLPLSAPENCMSGTISMATLYTRCMSRLSFFGNGAGKYPTGCALASDILDVAHGRGETPKAGVRLAVDNSAEAHPYYIRANDSALASLDCVEKDLGGAVMTKPMAVSALHALYNEKLIKLDPQAFFAGVKEN